MDQSNFPMTITDKTELHTFNTETHVTIWHNDKSYLIPTGLFINNQFVQSSSNHSFVTVNPTTGMDICRVSEANGDDIDMAVKAAKQGQIHWFGFNSDERCRIINKLAGLIERDAEILAELEALDTGKPIVESLGFDLPNVAGCLRYYAGWCDKYSGSVVDISKSLHAYTIQEPFGVVGAIISWSFPLVLLTWKLGPALATGNSIIIKTSEKAPLSALKVAELVVEAGFPPGVINVVSGSGDTGNHLTLHRDIDFIAFTGSTLIGREILKHSAESNLKKVSLSLGGKSANIVFNDADLDKAIDSSEQGNFI